MVDRQSGTSSFMHVAFLFCKMFKRNTSVERECWVELKKKNLNASRDLVSKGDCCNFFKTCGGMFRITIVAAFENRCTLPELFPPMSLLRLAGIRVLWVAQRVGAGITPGLLHPSSTLV